MWAIVLLIFFVTGSRQISITEFSVPDTVESGGEILLQCGYELSSNETGQGLTVKWWFTPLDKTVDERIQLYQKIGQQPATTKSVIEIKGDHDILLQDVTPECSGTYECEVSAIEDEKRQHDDLIVFSKGELVLNVTEVEDGPDEDNDKDVLITCTATDVAPFPTLVITVNEAVLISNDTVFYLANKTYDVINNVTLSRGEAHGAQISCELSYGNTTLESYRITQTFEAASTELSTTEEFGDASTTEATPGNRVTGPASNLLLVILAFAINIFAIKK